MERSKIRSIMMALSLVTTTLYHEDICSHISLSVYVCANMRDGWYVIVSHTFSTPTKFSIFRNQFVLLYNWSQCVMVKKTLIVSWSSAYRTEYYHGCCNIWLVELYKESPPCDQQMRVQRMSGIMSGRRPFRIPFNFCTIMCGNMGGGHRVEFLTFMSRLLWMNWL